MTDQTATPAETAAAALFERYIEARLSGQEISASRLLSQCPEAGKQVLDEAIEGADWYLAHFHATYVRPDVMQRTLEGLEAIKRKKAWMAETRSRAEQGWELNVQVPTNYLAALIGIQAGQALAGSHGQQALNQPLVLHRTGSGSPSSTRLVDAAWRRVRTQALSENVEELLRQMHITEAPIDLDLIAQRLYLFVQEVDMGQVEGCLVTDGNVGGILINKAIPNRQRKRYTLAHEIAHFILHKTMRVFSDTHQELLDDPQSPTEIEANLFASLLLLPPSFLPADFGRPRPQLAAADALRQRFDVSLEAALRRIVGQSRWRCAFVVSHDNVISHSVCSPHFDGFIRWKQPLHPATRAHMLYKSGQREERTATLSAEVWMDGAPVHQDAEVYEQSRLLSEGYVYSLLTIVDPD